MKLFKNTYYCLCATYLCLTPLLSGKAEAEQLYSPAITGFLGLNTVPNARMDETGTIRASISTLDPYIHGYIGLQIADQLHINIRQSAETSNIIKTAKRLYPGIDLKLRLLKENANRPEISIGAVGALGHKKMASEYIAASKHYKNLDITAGLGWGRMGSAGHFDNPLKAISKHFDKDRDQNSETPNDINSWFSGSDIGVFAGLEYFTPIDGLSLKFDYSADRYISEKENFDFNTPSPWGAGLSYSHSKWANAGVAIQGIDKIMGRISLKSKPSKWMFSGKKYGETTPFYKNRNHELNIPAIKQSAENDNITLSNIHSSKTGIYANIEISPHPPTPQQIGRALRHIAANSGYNIEEISITPVHADLYGRTIKTIRKDVENSLDNNNSSPQEIWKNTEFIVTDKENIINNHNPSKKWISNKTDLIFSLENQISLSEEDSGILYRSSATIEGKSNPFLGIIIGSKMRINIKDNLDKVDDLRSPALNPIRSDINAFTDKRLNLDGAYIGYNQSLTPDLHASLLSGYLEEFYSGIGGEVLYRPFSSRFSVGAEIWNLSRRNPYTTLNLGIKADRTISGHINAWYDLPNQDLTVSAKAGRYLAGDIGGSIGLVKKFKNGAKLDTSFTLTNYSDPDLFGGTTHAYHSLNLKLPLGSIPHITEGSNINTTIAPFGRDVGQSINAPVRLYDMTENFTLNHIANHWNEILD